MLRHFYECALPTHGVYCCTTIRQEDGKATNYFAETIDGLIKIIEEHKNIEGTNVFVALSVFDGYSRKGSNALCARSFFIDLDVGTGAKKYPSQAAALTALDEFIKFAELPPPVRVDSGTGIHAYWLLDTDVPTNEWRGYAEKFKAMCLEHLNIDPTVTADRSRIMRCPETFNHKTTPPNPTKFIDKDIYQYSFEVFKTFLGPVTPNVETILNSVPKGLDEDTLKLIKADNFESVFQTIAEKSLAGDGCNQIKYILTNAATLSEPLWHSGLSIAHHCVDGDEAIHLMSEDYPDYNREQTIRKANETHNKPHSCIVFEDRNPGGCNGCPYRGKITNPLALGRRLKATSPEDTVRLQADSQNLPAFPAYLNYYLRGLNGGIYYKAPPVVDKNGKKIEQEEVMVSRYELHPFKRMFSPTEGECLMMRHVLPHDVKREFLLPMKNVYAQDRFKESMSAVGVLFEPSKQHLLTDYIIRWGRYLQGYNQAEQMRPQMGWTDNLDGFVIGDKEIQRDGNIIVAAASPLVHSIAKLLREEGNYDIWKIAVNKLNIPSFELAAFCVLCGFGSPLMRFTSTSGASVCFTGGTGNGKTGALYAQLSVWGHPKDLSLAGGREQATENGLVGWFMGLKNIPLGLDEASNRRPEELSNLVHRVAQGKGKIRMQGSVNAVREMELSASMITTFTSNQSIYDKLQTLKAAPEGEMARLIEFTMDRPQAMTDTPGLGKQIFDTVRYNYGYAGTEFIQQVFKIGEQETRDTVDKWITKFSSNFGRSDAYRFYENLMGAAFGGGEIAIRAGIIDFDLDRIYKAVIRHIIGIRDEVKINLKADHESMFGEFQNRYFSGTLILEGDRVVSEPRAALVARAEVDKERYYASSREMKKFLAEAQISSREFVYVMKEKGIMIGECKQRLSNGWPGRNTATPVNVWIFAYNLPKDLIASLEDKK